MSAVSGQFRNCRDALASDLRAIGADVIVQDDFQQHAWTLLEKLQHKVAGCERVISLVGNAYGFEPSEESRPPDRPRRSYTQWEYHFALGERLEGPPAPLNNLAALLIAKGGRSAEAEPLMRHVIETLQRFRQATGHEHSQWGTALKNYQGLLNAMGLPDEEIGRRLASLGP